MSCASILSIFTHIICYLTGSLHPLVVLTLAIQFMVLWIANTAGVAVLYANDAKTGCAAGFGGSSSWAWREYGYLDGFFTDDELQALSNGSCAMNTGILVLTILVT